MSRYKGYGSFPKWVEFVARKEVVFMITMQIVGGPGRAKLGYRLFEGLEPGPEQGGKNTVCFEVVTETATSGRLWIKFRIFSASVAHDPFDGRRLMWKFAGLIDGGGGLNGKSAIIQYNISNQCGTLHVDDESTARFSDWLKENR